MTASPAAATTTIALSRASVIGGESIRVSGTTGVKVARPVVLQRLSGTSWVKVVAGKTTSTGTFSFTYKPPTTVGSKRALRVQAPRVTIGSTTYGTVTTASKTVVTVAQTATLTAGSTATVGQSFHVVGTFKPVRTGRPTQLQRLIGTTWTMIDDGEESSTGVTNFYRSLPAGTHQIRVVALARSGAPAKASAVKTVTSSDKTPPDQPYGVSVIGGDLQAQITWNPVLDDGDLAGYRVFHSSSQSGPWVEDTVTAIPPGTQAYTATGLTNGTSYYFAVTSTDTSGNQSEKSPSSLVVPRTVIAGSWTMLAPGAQTCGIKVGGTGWCWGSNHEGELGNATGFGTFTGNPDPLQVTGAWSSLTTASGHSCGIKSDGSAWCWGDNQYGVLGNGLDGGAPYSTPTQVPGSWKSISTGYAHTCAIKTDNTGWCWGWNEYGQLGTITNSGTSASNPNPIQVAGSWSNLITGDYHTCGVKADGTGWCWGWNTLGQLGTTTSSGTQTPVPTPHQVPGAWSQMTAGTAYTCGFKTDGTLWCWGDNFLGQQGVSRGNGNLDPKPYPTPAQVPGTWANVSAGGATTCGVKANGTGWCWGGDNYYGQTGNMDSFGAASMLWTPTRVAGSWTKITVGEGHTCGIATDSTGWCWGANSAGEAGHSGADRGPTPVQVGTG